ncbi:MAG: helix-turn-helix domain-containing protein [Chloroflexota bacterium]|nr:helix-turn-helix domain-containing protein [Chloroflexota bacterium]
MSVTTNDYLTIEEAAELLRVSTSTVRRWIREGDIVAHRAGKRRILLRRTDIARSVSEVGFQPKRPARGLSPMGFQWRDRPVERRLTSEEFENRLAALERAREASAKIQERTGVKEFPPSWPLIREMRDERMRRLLGEEESAPGSPA